MNDRKPPENEVTEASEESFPASDPPAYTGARAGTPAGHARKRDEEAQPAGRDAAEVARGGPRADQLRDSIDRGQTGDKVAGGDPAAAPLGTDEEAAGTGPSPAAVTAALDAERRDANRPAAVTEGAQPRPRPRIALWILALVAAVAIIWWASS